MSSYNETTRFLHDQAQQAFLAARGAQQAIGTIGQLNREPKSIKFRYSGPGSLSGAPDLGGDFFVGGDDSNGLISQANADAQAWMNRYFPAINGCLRNQPEQMICDIISGVKPFGIDKTVLELVWEQARDRASRTTRASMETMRAQYSALGFELPPGAMVAAGIDMQNAADAEAINISREQAIKDADIRVDMMKHAIQIGANLKAGVFGALASFYRATLAAPDRDKSVERSRIQMQAQVSLMNALNDYRRIEVSLEQLRLEAAKADTQAQVETGRLDIALNDNYKGLPAAYADAAQAFASIAQGAAQAGGSLAAQIESL